MEKQSLDSFRKNVRSLGITLRNNEKSLVRKEGGVSITQFHVLCEIRKLNSCSMVEVSENLFLDKSKVSRAIDKLVKLGLVNREIDPQKRRYSIVLLTEKGERTIQYINNKSNIMYEDILLKFSSKDRKTFLELFDYFVAAIKEKFTLP